MIWEIVQELDKRTRWRTATCAFRLQADSWEEGEGDVSNRRHSLEGVRCGGPAQFSFPVLQTGTYTQTVSLFLQDSHIFNNVVAAK